MATAEKAIYDRLAAAPTFHPASAALFANDWALDAGDVVAVKSGEDTFSVPIYGMTLDWKGNSMIEIQSTGNEERKPISALKRRQFASGRGGYRQKKEIDGYYQRLIEDHGSMGMIAGALGVVLDADGNPVTDPTTGKLVYDQNSPAEMFSRLLTTPNYAELVSALNSGTQQISGAKINLSSQGSVLIQAINNRPGGESSVTIDADKINLTGYVTATALDTRMANVDQLFTTAGYAGTIYAGSASITGQIAANTVIGSPYVQAAQLWLLDGEGNRSVRITGTGVSGFGTVTSSTTGEISIPYYTFQVPVGSANPAGTINFNIANMAYYQNHVGISTVSPAKAWSWDADDGYSMLVTATAKDGTTKSCGVQPPTITMSTNLGTSATTAVHCYGPEVSGNQHALATQYSLYLKADNDYCYITKSDATPDTSESGNVLARIANPGGNSSITWPEAGTSGSMVVAATINGTADNKTFYVVEDNSYAYIRSVSSTSGGVTYARVTNNAYGNGQSSVTIDAMTADARTDDETTYNNWTINNTLGTGGYKYVKATFTASNNNTYVVRVNAAATYNAGHTAGVADGEAKFTQATVTLQGASAGIIYKRKTSGSIRIKSTSIVQVGTAYYYTRHAVSEKPTSAWYTRSTSKPASGTTYDERYASGGSTSVYVSDSSGTYYYLGDGSVSNLYNAGTPDSTTYYTKSS